MVEISDRHEEIATMFATDTDAEIYKNDLMERCKQIGVNEDWEVAKYGSRGYCVLPAHYIALLQKKGLTVKKEETDDE